MSTLRDFFSAAFDKMKDIMGEEFVYCRDPYYVTVTGIVSSNEVMGEDISEVYVLKDSKNFRIRRSELILNGEQVEPESRDYIVYDGWRFSIEGNDGFVIDAADETYLINTHKRGYVGPDIT